MYDFQYFTKLLSPRSERCAPERSERKEGRMRALSYTAVRENLSRTMAEVCQDHDPVIITRRNHQAVVMLSLEDYESLSETAYLLRSPRNARRLLDSIEELESGKGRERELLE